MKFKRLIVVLGLVMFTSGSIFGSEVLKKEITFNVDHATKYVTGICSDITVDEVKIQQNGRKYNLKSPFQISVPVVKITSGDDGRDDHIKEILGYPEFPLVQIKVESVQLTEGSYTIKGKLTIHGRTKDFSSNAIVSEVEANVISIEGKVIAKFSEYELENPSLLFMKAKDDIQINYAFQIKVK
ncbi:MAG: YceI family protein [Leptospira sp.]|nr:YceI family protein [Leptospira sp.]